MNHLFKGIKHLTNESVESEFSKIFGNSLFGEFELFIDLSQLTFAQLSAINYLTLRIDDLCKKNLVKNLFVSYPLKKYSNKEYLSKNTKFVLELRANLLRNRIKVNGFLKNVRLWSALKQSAHENNIQIYLTENFDFEAEFNQENFESAFEEIVSLEANKQSGYEYLYPLEWITVNETLLNYDKLEERFNKILENKERGLAIFDVQALKNVIFSELSKNVQEHTTFEKNDRKFLLSIGLVSTYSFKKIQLDGNIEKEFIEWSLKEGIPSLIEIYFGDTGGGFYNSTFIEACKKDNVVSDEEQLMWSFNKWTSKKNNEERRGTKGLYRINRIVNNYNGIFHILTNNQNGGFRKGGFREPRWINRSVTPPFNGSFIQIKLCPYSVVKEFKLRLVDNQRSDIWRTFSLSSDFPESALLQKIQVELKSDRKILCIIDLDKNREFCNSDKISLLQSLLLEISYNSHPSGVVVFINSTLDKPSIDTVIDSINEFTKSKTHLELSDDRDNEIIYDPVIVIFGDSTFWYGGNKNVVDILNEVYENNFNVKLAELKSYQNLPIAEQIKIRQGLENDNRLVHVNSKGEIELVFIDIETLFSNILQDRISATKVRSDIKVCTPKVYIADYWLNVKYIIKDNELGFALVLYLKSLRHLDSQNKRQLFLLIDHKQHIELAYYLLNLFNIDEKYLVNIENEIQINSFKRVKLIPEKSNVIILTSIVSSSETIRRLVKYVKRDNANPIVVLNLCNFRKYDISELETWGSKTKIESVYQKYESNQPKIPRDKIYFEEKIKELSNFKGGVVQPNFKVSNRESKMLIDSKLIEHFKTSKSLNFNHIGIKNDRHFTFYIDKFKLLNSENLITKAINDKIVDWIDSNKIDKYTIYVKNDLLYNGEGFLKDFLLEMYSNLEIYDEVPIVEYSESLSGMLDPNLLNAFIIDFGLFSGHTVNQMLNNFKGLDNLFICILFDQSDSNEFEHYKRLISLKNSLIFKSKPTNLTIDFLFKLPLKYFNRDNCPICNHIDALEDYKMSDDNKDYMFNFSEDRQRRLQIKRKIDISREDYPFDFYYEYPIRRNQELSSNVLTKMFSLKLSLEDALVNTNSRIDIFEYLFYIYSNIDEQISNPDSDLYALVFYLSNEVHWLQKEPLVFRDYRILLTHISAILATMKIDILIDIFKKNSTFKVSPLDSATRYKYSAISLLRSSNKLEFCKKIGVIISSSNNQNRYSNNLLQNCFYHTFSILKNKYNKSKIYFEELKKSYSLISNIKEIPDINDDGSYGPKNTVERLSNIITSKLIEIDIEKLDDIGIIKQLKIIYREKYQHDSHPELEIALQNRSLKHLSDDIGLPDIAVNKEDSKYYDQLWMPLLDSNQYWHKVKTHILENIIPYYKLLSENFKYSRTVKNDFALHTTFEKLLKDGIENPIARFGSIIAQLNSEPLKYLQLKEQYDKLHTLFYDFLIKKDSIFNSFINQFPLDITDVLKQSLFLKRFEDSKITGQDIYKVFYPSIRFTGDLNNILSSIKNRTSDEEKAYFESNGRFKNIACKVDFSSQKEEKYIYLTISYNNTDSSSHSHPNNEIGGLESIKQEVRKFGGDVLFESIIDENGFFNIAYKFLRYE
ncbi:MAG TPA: hypothetical protein DEO54_09530 [Rikenellaceae bacterium]|nr:MAG: hypothetical protein A2X20_08835 [Bacteroidetes bacterium GWE2_40_15]HBZ26454.1 hypothetical protein [Rikenellaceae bacterium]